MTAEHSPDSRPLTPKEREVVLKELRASRRGARLLGVVALGVGVMCAGAMVMFVRSSSWLMSLMMGATMVFASILGLLLLSGRRNDPKTLESPPVLTLRALCQTQRTGKQSWPYVGPYRVLLRAGWQSFWPEGEHVTVELCLPPKGTGSTLVGAVLVSLPGIDITTWLERPPPLLRLKFVTLGMVAGVFTFILAVLLTSADYWPRAAVALRTWHHPLTFADVDALREAHDAIGARVTLQSGRLVRFFEGEEYLCGSKLPQLSNDAAPPEWRSQVFEEELNGTSDACVRIAPSPATSTTTVEGLDPLLALPADTVDTPTIVAVASETGVLTPELTWRRGDDGPTLWPLFSLLALAFTTLGAGPIGACDLRRHHRELAAWTASVRRLPE